MKLVPEMAKGLRFFCPLKFTLRGRLELPEKFGKDIVVEGFEPVLVTACGGVSSRSNIRTRRFRDLVLTRESGVQSSIAVVL